MESLDRIQHIIDKSRSQSTLAADSPILLGASKGQGAGMIEEFIRAGLTHYGENRVQEAMEKWPELKKRHPHVTLHLIGPLQTNKVKEALVLFDVIQTLDRPKLAEAIAGELKKKEEKSSVTQLLNSSIPQFYIQVNTGEEAQKSGILPKEAPELIRYCQHLGLNIAGLMCVPPAGQMPAPHFALLRKLALDNGLQGLSMGMSNDYEAAIRMGSTCVRIGTALFGERLR